jgi:ferrochelatase
MDPHGEDAGVSRVAVVLFNLGGPDRPEAVRPFLVNLFDDPHIIAAPAPVRGLLARLLASRRAKAARELYANIGGASPLLANTEAQAAALDAALAGGDDTIRSFIAMRYWHPLTQAAVRAVQAFEPDELILLPLYPQYSHTTTGSSLRVWFQEAAAGLQAPARVVCCYPSEPGFVAAVAALIRPAYERASFAGRPRILFSAHGLPKRLADQGDPYQAHVEMTVTAVLAKLGLSGLEWQTCYQSRVGPLEWIKPYTVDEIARAGAERRPLVVVPIAFVSEHSETLVELDIEYRRLALDKGVPRYERVPTVGTHPAFIAGLASLVRGARGSTAGLCPPDGRRLCAPQHGRCPCAA